MVMVRRGHGNQCRPSHGMILLMARLGSLCHRLGLPDCPRHLAVAL